VRSLLYFQLTVAVRRIFCFGICRVEGRGVDFKVGQNRDPHRKSLAFTTLNPTWSLSVFHFLNSVRRYLTDKMEIYGNRE